MPVMSVSEPFPRIDYASHPAYRSTGHVWTLDDGRVERGVAEVDAAFCELLTQADRITDGEEARFNAAVGIRIDELQAYVLGGMTGRIADYSARAMKVARQALLDEWKFQVRSHRFRYQPVLTAAQQRNLEILKKDGVVCLDPIPETASDLWNKMWWERRLLRRQADRLPWGRCAMALDPHSPAGVMLQRTDRKSVV